MAPFEWRYASGLDYGASSIHGFGRAHGSGWPLSARRAARAPIANLVLTTTSASSVHRPPRNHPVLHQMAPHKALAVPDILYEVFKHLSIRPQLSLPDAELGSFAFPSAVIRDDFKASKAKRRTLAHASRTCKAFAEPASRTLWEVLDTLAPIISMLRNASVSGTLFECARTYNSLSRPTTLLYRYQKANRRLALGSGLSGSPRASARCDPGAPATATTTYYLASVHAAMVALYSRTYACSP